jgi:hypothetical protein
MAGEWVAEARRVAQADKAAAKKPAGKA